MSVGHPRKLPGYERKARGYIYVKVDECHWRLKHYLIWEAANGPVPEGFVLYFVDGDRYNLRLENIKPILKNKIYSLSCNIRKKMIGTESIRRKYIWVKVAEPNVWRMKHHLIWEAAFGPIPKGYLVIFADRDKSNFKLDNLIMISRLMLFGQTKFRHYLNISELKIGSECIRHGYTFVKISQPNVWRMKHHLIWEATWGKIPKGHTVWFIDGDRNNFRLDNLVLVSHQETGYMISQGVVGVKGDYLKTAINVAKLGLLLGEKRRKLGKVKV